MNFVHGFTRSVSEDNSVHDLGIVNKKKIILEEAKNLVKYCRTWGLSFRELDVKVTYAMCDMV